eukprot:scaffold215631_cov39-Tisochrysis_lutea.AAC.1
MDGISPPRADDCISINWNDLARRLNLVRDANARGRRKDLFGRTRIRGIGRPTKAFDPKAAMDGGEYPRFDLRRLPVCGVHSNARKGLTSCSVVVEQVHSCGRSVPLVTMYTLMRGTLKGPSNKAFARAATRTCNVPCNLVHCGSGVMPKRNTFASGDLRHITYSM